MHTVSQEQPNKAVMGGLLRNIDSVNLCHICFAGEKGCCCLARWVRLQAPGPAITMHNLIRITHPNSIFVFFLRLTDQFHDQFHHSAAAKIMIIYMCVCVFICNITSRYCLSSPHFFLLMKTQLNLVIKRLLPADRQEQLSVLIKESCFLTRGLDMINTQERLL